MSSSYDDVAISQPRMLSSVITESMKKKKKKYGHFAYVNAALELTAATFCIMTCKCDEIVLRLAKLDVLK